MAGGRTCYLVARQRRTRIFANGDSGNVKCNGIMEGVENVEVGLLQKTADQQ
jgi:hypothetical protein